MRYAVGTAHDRGRPSRPCLKDERIGASEFVGAARAGALPREAHRTFEGVSEGPAPCRLGERWLTETSGRNETEPQDNDR